jgi:PAS domain S-box-containing protein
VNNSDINPSFLSAIPDAISVEIIVTDLTGTRIIYVNDKSCDLFNYSRADFQMIVSSELLYDGEAPHLWKTEKENTVVKFKTQDNKVIWGLMSSKRIKDKKGNDLGVFHSISNITRRKRAEDQLQQSQKKRKQLSNKLIHAQEAERKRIAVELHDGISSNITAVRLMLERKISEVGLNENTFENIINTLKTISSDTRRISRDLHPSILEDIGLVPALTSLIREFNEMLPDVVFIHQINIDENKINDKAKLTLYRILQEAINNIIKHSGADAITISSDLIDGYQQLEISDNGCSFDVDKVMNSDNEISGLGIESMKERTDDCHGTFQIESLPARGTRICVKVPTQ